MDFRSFITEEEETLQNQVKCRTLKDRTKLKRVSALYIYTLC